MKVSREEFEETMFEKWVEPEYPPILKTGLTPFAIAVEKTCAAIDSNFVGIVTLLEESRDAKAMTI
jgi:hypothetical protein